MNKKHKNKADVSGKQNLSDLIKESTFFKRTKNRKARAELIAVVGVITLKSSYL